MPEVRFDRDTGDRFVMSTPDAIFYADTETGEILAVEGGFEELFGYSREELVGREQTDLHPPAEEEAYRELFARHWDNAPAVISEFEDGSPVYIVTKSAEYVPVEINSWETELDGRTVIQGVFRDLRPAIRRNRRLTQYQEAVESATNPIAAVDKSYRYLFANPAYMDPLGLDHAEIVGKPISAVLGEDVFEELQPKLDRGFDGEALQFELEREFPSGEMREFEVSYSPLKTSEGDVYGLIGAFNDITERKQREEELERLFDGMEDAAFLHPVEGQFQVVNQTAIDRYGYTEAELYSMSPAELDTTEEVERAEGRLQQLLEEGSLVFETVHRAKSGETVPVEISSSLIQYKGETAVLSIARDITKRLESERKFEVLFNNSRDAIVHTEFRDGKPFIRAVNPAFIDWFGHDEAGLVDQPLEVVFDTATTAYEMEEIDRRILNGEFLRMEVRRHTPEGTHDFLLRSIPIDPEAGEYYRIYTDITERKERERTLVRQRDELQTLNRLNELVLTVIQELVAAESRADIETIVCRELARSPLFELAWFGERDPESGHTRMRTCSVSEDDFNDITGFDPDGPEAEFGPAEQALATGEIQIVQNTSADPRFTTRGTGPGAREVKSIAAVPLLQDGAVYSTLVIYAPREYAFTGRELAGLEALGKIVEFAINAVRNRKLLMTDTVAEVEFDATESELPLVAISAELECQIVLDGFVGTDTEDEVTMFLEVTGTPPEAFLEAVRAQPLTARASQLTEDEGDGYRVELTMACGLCRELEQRHKAVIRTIDLDSGTGRYVFDVPLTEDVRDIVEIVRSEAPGAEFVAKREREYTTENPLRLGSALEAELTDRQLEILKTALLSGYFEWPRDKSATEVAETIGITSSTFQYHLRKAQQTVFDRLFGQ